MRKNRRFVTLDKINFDIARRGFKYSLSKKKVIGALCCSVVSFIVPDGSVGLILGLCVLSPIGFKHALRDKKQKVKDWIVSRYYKVRWRF